MHEHSDPELQQVIQRSIAELSADVIPRVSIVGVREQNASPRGGDGRHSKGAPERELLTDDVLVVFDRICRHFWETMQERWEALRFDRSKEQRERGDLVRRGLIERVGKIGKLEFFSPTEKGLALARSRGLPRHRFKSGPMHEIVIRRLRQAIAAAKLGVSFK